MMSQQSAQGPGDLVPPEQLLAMSGLDFIQGMLEGRLPAPPIARTLNFTMEAAEDGQAMFRGAPEFGALNPMGTVHGGWYGTILDSCMGCAVMTKVPQGKLYMTLEYKLNIVRALPLGREALAVGRVQHAGRSPAIAQGESLGADGGQLHATRCTPCMTFPPCA